MGLVFGALVETLRQPTIGGVVAELVLFSVPVWLALFIGLLVGWAWRPRWAADLVCGDKGNSRHGYPQLRSSSSSELSSGLESHKAQADETTGKATSMYDDSPIVSIILYGFRLVSELLLNPGRLRMEAMDFL